MPQPLLPRIRRLSLQRLHQKLHQLSQIYQSSVRMMHGKLSWSSLVSDVAMEKRLLGNLSLPILIPPVPSITLWRPLLRSVTQSGSLLRTLEALLMAPTMVLLLSHGLFKHRHHLCSKITCSTFVYHILRVSSLVTTVVEEGSVVAGLALEEEGCDVLPVEVEVGIM